MMYDLIRDELTLIESRCQGQHINTHHLQLMGKKFADALLLVRSRHFRPSLTALDLVPNDNKEQSALYVTHE